MYLVYVALPLLATFAYVGWCVGEALMPQENTRSRCFEP